MAHFFPPAKQQALKHAACQKKWAKILLIQNSMFTVFKYCNTFAVPFLLVILIFLLLKKPGDFRKNMTFRKI